ncbi:MAG: LysR family transcriptional regulator [Burkholderiaceae bacterium]
MDIQQLNCFVKVVQLGSFTKAAVLLNKDKAFISRSISDLERELKVRLLERSTRSLRLTEIGQAVNQRALGILAAIDETRHLVQFNQSVPQGILRLSCGIEFGMLGVSSWIAAYLARYPEMQVDADLTGRVVDLIEEGFDLAIRIGPLADSQLVARKLGELQRGLYASPSYLKQHPAPKNVSELSRHSLLMSVTGTNRSEWNFVDADSVTGPAKLRVNNNYVVRDAALQGLGIGRMPCIMAQPQVEQGLLLPVLQEVAIPSVDVSAVYPNSRFLAPKVRAFVDLAAVEFSKLSIDQKNKAI